MTRAAEGDMPWFMWSPYAWTHLRGQGGLNGDIATAVSHVNSTHSSLGAGMRFCHWADTAVAGFILCYTEPRKAELGRMTFAVTSKKSHQ